MSFSETPSAEKVETKQRPKSVVGWLIFGALSLAAKGKALLLLLPKLKLILVAGSMAVSLVAYAWVLHLGWLAAFGFVMLLFIHEMGHVLVLRKLKVPASVPMFIPFIGAVISIKKMPKNSVDEAKVALGGPVVGGLAAFGCLLLYGTTDAPIWLFLAGIGALLNLFNLIPVSPLDGGRIVGCISRNIWVLGLLILIGVGVAFQSFIIMAYSVLALMELDNRYLHLHRRQWWIVSAALAVCTALSFILGFGPFMIAAFILATAWTAYNELIFKVLAAKPSRARLRLGGADWLSRFGAILAVQQPIEAAQANGAPDTAAAVKDDCDSETAEMAQATAYFSVPTRVRVAVGTVYLTLALSLGWLLYHVYVVEQHLVH